MDDLFQSAYKANHSTETALVKVQNDVLRTIRSIRGIWHSGPRHPAVSTLSTQRFGIKGTALNWFSPYPSEGKQFVCVNGTASSHRYLPYGVPRGSVLARAPMLFLMYTVPLTYVIRKHVKASCKSAFFHLKQLPVQAAETLIHSLVTSKVDFCYSLLNGVPNQLRQKLQIVQNSAARQLTYIPTSRNTLNLC